MADLKTVCNVSAVWVPNSGQPKPARKPFEALWDTGAQVSVVSQSVVSSCGLVASGIQTIRGVGDIPQRTLTFLVDIELPNKVVVTGLRVALSDLPGADILIGMDIIRSGDFAVTNFRGTTTFSFRLPSIGHIDFVPESNLSFLQHGPGRRKRNNRKH